MSDIDRVLRKIASNLWFEWNADIHLLLRSISPYIWGLFRRNIYRFLRLQAENPALYQRRLAELLTNAEFLGRFQKVQQDYTAYMQRQETFVSQRFPELANPTIAYFSMEYGIDILKIYSGGLGILSGDHLRGASDIGLKMVGVGLFYLHGYFDQQVSSSGKMKVLYDSILPLNKPVRDFLPLELLKRTGTTEELVIEVPMKERKVRARVWRARVGRCDLLLLDSNLPQNHVHDRHITRRLYASQKYYDLERRRRLEQELLLGLGGVLAVESAGFEASVFHLNEGHVAFVAIELIHQHMKKYSLSFEEARKRCADILGFTTHTPVPEGNERFDERLVREYLQPYLDSFLPPQDREFIFNCARNRQDQFDMTKLSLLLAGYRNGVSKIHGEVCRKMWCYAWGLAEGDDDKVPIDSITNAVHVPYWQKPLLRQLIESYGGLSKVREIEDEKIWLLHLEFKRKLLEKVRERYAYQLLRESANAETIHEKTRDFLDLDAFLIGFARRFADYKRTTLVLEDEERLFGVLEESYRKYGRPVHFLFAGKPHPNNYPAHERIRQIVEAGTRLAERARARNFRSQIIFIEGYDIDLARYLEAGVDVWLNNPIRPLEASGTSGMKAGMNGVLNISIADGWVPEGIQQGKNGWIFGKGDASSGDEDRAELLKLLEDSVLPLYFEKTGNVTTPEGVSVAFSRRWTSMMKESIQTLTQQFNTDRMLTEYIEKMYLPAIRRHSEAKPKNPEILRSASRPPSG